MNTEDYIPEALAIVAGWEVEAEEFAQAVNDQARLMAGLYIEAPVEPPEQSPYASLRF